MLKLTATKLDTGNCRLYCIDQNGSKFVIVNLNTSNNPSYWPHSHTTSGEPDCPVKEGYEWVLSENKYDTTDFYIGLSNKVNSIDDFERLCTEKHNETRLKVSQYCQLLKRTDKVEFQLHFKQALDLEKRCEDALSSN
ncbi:hypothetical protein [Pseudoalteromonas marina]|uniref:Uncharacterized protein n=1 Tax=Pseudoalteromonas marina TaxID=267375 RepID=A0ABT9FCG6_9GAMM|nr:hypothetical protein [Pseudoalteromonas marina]MDP2564482.1 hypothetical protein [Pseudoalteromonas marina]